MRSNFPFPSFLGYRYLSMWRTAISCGMQTTPPLPNSTVHDSHRFAFTWSLVKTTTKSFLLCQMSVNARGFWKSISSSSGRASSLIGLCNALFFPFLFFFSFAFSPALWGMWAKAIFLICPQTSWILWDIPRDFRLFRQQQAHDGKDPQYL